MHYNSLTAEYAVAPQIDPADMAGLAEAGFTTILCNRPDVEVPGPFQAEAMRAAAQAAGLAFVDNPFTHGQLTEDLLSRQAETLASASGPVLAYCASGTRCTILWLLLQARAGADIDAALGAAERAGYQLGGLRPQLQSMAAGG